MAKPTEPRRLSELGALRVLYPDRWAAKVRAAMRRARGFLDPASAELGVDRRTLQRWLTDPLLGDVEVAAKGRHASNASASK